jgi:hypothetical protein
MRVRLLPEPDGPNKTTEEEEELNLTFRSKTASSGC